MTPEHITALIKDTVANIRQAVDISSLRATHEKPMCALRTRKGQIVIQLGESHIPVDLVQRVADGFNGSGIKATLR